MPFRKKSCLSIFIILSIFPFFTAFAQNKLSYISGMVYDKDSGDPLQDAIVLIRGMKEEYGTDKDGKFKIRLYPGNHRFVISFIGYEEMDTLVNTGNRSFLKFGLKHNNELKGIVITSGRKTENITRPYMGVQNLSGPEIKEIPALMGEVDVIKAIQLLPGVQSTSEGSSGFTVRGGSSDQNLILLDGVNIYNASHMFGFFSIFNNDAVENAELYKGNIPIKYGGRLSSLLDVRLKNDPQDKISGTGGVGLISSRLTMQGPIGRKTTWLVSCRRSYADLFLKLSSDPERRNESLYFYDLNAKISHRISRKNKLYIDCYKGSDNFESSIGNFGYGNYMSSVTWDHAFSSNSYSRLMTACSEYRYNMGSKIGNSNVKWKSSISDFNLKWSIHSKISDKFTVDYGISSIFHTFDPAIITRTGYPDYNLHKNYALESAAYIGLEHHLGQKITVKYGLRATIFQNIGKGTVYTYDDNYKKTGEKYYGSGNFYHTYFRPEYRMGIVYAFDKKSSVKAGFSHNIQYIQIANNSSSGSPLDLWFPAGPNIKPQEAELYSVGYFRNFLNNKIEASVEFYYKQMHDVIDFKDNARLLLNDELEGEIRTGSGKALGMELMISKRTGNFTGFMNYTLSRTERTIPGINDGKTYLAPNDRTHNIKILLSYDLSAKWSFSSGWTYATGTPATYPVGRMIIMGEYYPIYSERNNSRMKDYHRIDLSATYKPSVHKKKKWKGEWVFSVYNAYWRKNPWMISFDQDTTSDGFPKARMTYLFGAIPSITYNFRF